MIKKITFLGFAMIAICMQAAVSQVVANFDLPQGTNVCANQCITANDLSTSPVNITIRTWTVTGGPATIDDSDDQNPIFCFPVTGTFLIELTVTDANGDVGNANTQVSVVVCPGSVNAGFIAPSAVCLGDCITLRDTSEGNPVSWDWVIVGGTATFQPLGSATSEDQNPEICFFAITTTDPIQIELTIEGADGKVSKATQQVNVVEIPTVEVSADTIVEIGNPAIISATATGGSKYRWEPNETVVNPKVLTTFAYPIETTDYVITVSDGAGCSASDTVKIYLNFLPNIGVPSAFSPNGDGRNDLLVVKGLGLNKCIFKVYNRYGIGIFASTEQKNGWDGNYKGKQATPGVYYWTLEYEFNTGKEGTLSGNTTLVR